MKHIASATALLVLLAAGAAQARNIDLVTLPPRDTVQLTIYNSEDLTLVRETRSITFKKGTNRLEFSWANTLIDPTSCYFRPLAHDSEIEVLDTTFPQDRPEVLIWNVDSKFEGQVPVEVSYFTSGISWNADYVMVTNAAETTMALDGFVTVINSSGEDYEGAQVRLVVGTVNLVEKIARLAQPAGNRRLARNLGAIDKLSDSRATKEEALEQTVLAADADGDKPSQGRGKFGAAAPPRIVKEGLSEYFIFTVEGQQTVKTGWSQRMISMRGREVPFDILYRYRPHQYGPKPARFFILANDKPHKMGDSPLPDGMIRVFRENGRDGLTFYVAQSSKYIPINEKIELNVGKDDQIVYERVVLDLARQNFIYDEDHKPEPIVVGWDETQKWQEEIRNYRQKPIKMEIRHVLQGDVEFGMEVPGLKLYDFHTVEYTLDLPASAKKKFTSDGLFRLGRNQKQNEVRLKP
jgi:hypothetical protein